MAYLLAAVFCGLFAWVYECFSHEVYSYFMICAFVFPLVGGALVFLLLKLLPLPDPAAVPRSLYHAGIATLTVGSIVRGILDIYGTTNALTRWYWIMGGVLTVLGVVTYLFNTWRFYWKKQ